MAGRVYVNNFSTTINGSITNVATSIVITSATGLPTLSGSEYYYLTITDGTNTEIVKVTSRVTTTLTVVRGQEGTTGTAFASLSSIKMNFTAESVVDWTDATGNISTTGTVRGGNLKFTTNTLSSQDTNGDINLLPNGTGFLVVGGGTATTTMKFMEASGSGTNFVALKAPTTLAGNVTYTFPTADGTSGYVLSTNGSGTLSWIASGGGGVSGPGSSTNNGIVLFSGTGGSTLKDAAATNGLIYGLTVGRGNSGVSTNTAFGTTAFNAVTSGANSVAVGYEAGKAITSGTNSVYVGSQAGVAHQTGGQNVIVGTDSFSAATNLSSMVAVGYQALKSTYAGADQTAIGYNAGYTSVSAGNTFVGSKAGGHTTGFSATGVTAVGYEAAYRASGADVTVFGYSSCNNSGGFGGSRVVAVGNNIAPSSSGCDDLVAIGHNAMNGATTGGGNTAVGAGAGNNGVGASTYSGTNNTYLGKDATSDTGTSVGCIAIGSAAVAAKDTGATSSDHGPGIAIGSSTYKVGFRGDGTIYPTSGASAGYWKVKINGTAYKIQLYAL